MWSLRILAKLTFIVHFMQKYMLTTSGISDHSCILTVQTSKEYKTCCALMCDSQLGMHPLAMDILFQAT
jgi:hypothetical protein